MYFFCVFALEFAISLLSVFNKILCLNQLFFLFITSFFLVFRGFFNLKAFLENLSSKVSNKCMYMGHLYYV